MVPPYKLKSSADKKLKVPFSSSTSLFSWTFLMAYSEAKLKSSGNEASPCFRPF
jgi:hypothetical protein